MDLNQFAQDVDLGLSSSPKRLFSKYFYDQIGDGLFQKIMHLDEYYLTRAELAIFQEHKADILRNLDGKTPFRLIELGPGDGLKTKVLLKYFIDQQVQFQYSPVDISANVLQILEKTLKQELPDLKIDMLTGDFFKVLHELKIQSHVRNVVFFLGSNVGNFPNETAIPFLIKIRENLNPGDLLMIGFDLKKHPDKILAAYNDASGVTRKFNLNLLHRINRELGGDFDEQKFIHYPLYNPQTGECRSYLVSTCDQTVHIESLDRSYHFHAWETLFMEISKKYAVHEVEELASQCGFDIRAHVFDQDKLFVDSIWEVK